MPAAGRCSSPTPVSRRPPISATSSVARPSAARLPWSPPPWPWCGRTRRGARRTTTSGTSPSARWTSSTGPRTGPSRCSSSSPASNSSGSSSSARCGARPTRPYRSSPRCAASRSRHFSTWRSTPRTPTVSPADGRSRPRRTSPSPWPCWPWSAPTCRPSLRAFLLTLAVVDDLVVIVIIAVFYTSTLDVVALLGALAVFVVWAVLQRQRVGSPWVYLPLAVAAWWLVHESGIHATIAGVVLGLLVRVRRDDGEERSPAERLEHLLSPLSAAVAVPVLRPAVGRRRPRRRRPVEEPGRDRRRRSASWSASPWGSSGAPGSSPVSPAPSSHPASAGATWSGWPSSPGSASPSRCWSPTSRSRGRPGTSRRPPYSPGRCSRRSSAPCVLGHRDRFHVTP